MFRLRELRESSGMRRSDFCRDVNMSSATIANYEKETREANYAKLKYFAKYFGVTVDYLIGYDPETTEVTHPVSEASGLKFAPLNLEERTLIQLFRSCASTAKTNILDYARLWAQSPDKQKQPE